MSRPVRTGLAWALLLGAPLLWFGHFGFVYASASLAMVFEPRAGLPARLAIAAGTLGALALVAAIWWQAPRFAPAREPVRRFWIVLTRLLATVSAVGIVYQATPALLVP